MKKLYVALIVVFILIPTVVLAHPGRLDSNGGHYNRSTGEYHYHDGSSSGQTIYGSFSDTSDSQSKIETPETEIESLKTLNEKYKDMIFESENRLDYYEANSINELGEKNIALTEQISNMWLGFTIFIIFALPIAYSYGTKQRTNK